MSAAITFFIYGNFQHTKYNDVLKQEGLKYASSFFSYRSMIVSAQKSNKDGNAHNLRQFLYANYINAYFLLF